MILNTASISILVYCVLPFGPIQGQQLNRLEGSACRFEHLTGTCVDARKCTTFKADAEKKNHPPICSFQGKYAVVCCTACIIKDKIDPPPPPLPKLVAKCREYYARLPYVCRPAFIIKRNWKELSENGSCYHALWSASAPVGGSDAKRNDHPHMVLLGYGESQESAQWLCAGSIISQRFILTAGHCASEPLLGPVTFAAMGILKRSDPLDEWQVHRVKRFIPHPQYRPPTKYHDIALIETDSDITFSISVMPACVGEGDLKDSRNTNYSEAHALGWGGLGPGKEVADTLQIVRLEKFTTQECSKLYPPHRLLVRGFDSATQICYGHHTEIKDTCGGDSGGPLIREFHGVSCTAHIVGVTSYGIACGQPGNAGMYTLVQNYEPWIESIVFP